MAKLIKITAEQIESAREEILKAIQKMKASDGELSFRFPLGKSERRAKLRITETAAWKMDTLIDEFDSEVGWHGIAKRVDGEKDTYEISDILIYPQEVTGVTVEQDQEKSEKWYDSLPDEVFNNLRMQGHSHVNMATSPSGTDRTLYKRFLDQLTDQMFYIFMILNKRGEKTILIYDMRENTLFETADVDMEIVEDGSGISKFLKDKKAMITRAVSKYPSYSSYSGTGYYGGAAGYTKTGYYGGSSYQTGGTGKFGSSPADRDYSTPPKGAAQPVSTAPKTPVPAAPAAKPAAPAAPAAAKRMGKPKGQWKKESKPAKPSYRNIYDYGYDDDGIYDY